MESLLTVAIMHHPPVNDIQTQHNVEHNPRSNEIALAALLKTTEETSRARCIVVASHIHNYERFLQDGVVDLVSEVRNSREVKVNRRSTVSLHAWNTRGGFSSPRFRGAQINASAGLKALFVTVGSLRRRF
jgi:hypothetical protein